MLENPNLFIKISIKMVLVWAYFKSTASFLQTYWHISYLSWKKNKCVNCLFMFNISLSTIHVKTPIFLDFLNNFPSWKFTEISLIMSKNSILTFKTFVTGESENRTTTLDDRFTDWLICKIKKISQSSQKEYWFLWIGLDS